LRNRNLIKWGFDGDEVYKSSALKIRVGGLINYKFLDKALWVRKAEDLINRAGRLIDSA